MAVIWQNESSGASWLRRRFLSIWHTPAELSQPWQPMARQSISMAKAEVRMIRLTMRSRQCPAGDLFLWCVISLIIPMLKINAIYDGVYLIEMDFSPGVFLL